MYIVKVDNIEMKVSAYDMPKELFILKCQNKYFEIEYPSGYVGLFLPPKNTNNENS